MEKCISGWKEIEFEVIRDSKGNVITVCSWKTLTRSAFTGDSIVIAPAVTLSDREYQMLRTAAINIISELEVEGVALPVPRCIRPPLSMPSLR